MEGTFKSLSLKQIVEINRQMIIEFGGFPFVEPDNLANGNSLLYILEAIHITYFGQELYNFDHLPLSLPDFELSLTKLAFVLVHSIGCKAF